MPSPRPSRFDDRGLTLPEILVAMAILTIGLLGVAGSLIVSSGGVSAGITRGQGAIERSYAVSAATVLAQEWIERIRRLVPTTFRCGTTCLGSQVFNCTGQLGSAPWNSCDTLASQVTAGFPAEAFGSISGFPNFSRSVNVESGVPGANMKTVTVTVRYKYSSGSRLTEEGISVSTIVAARP